MTRAHAAAAVLMAAACLGAWAGFSICPFAFVTGVPCPGCGLGRATLALLAGRPNDALRLHPLVFVVLPMLPVLGALVAADTRIGRAMQRQVVTARFERAVTLVGAWLIVALLGVWLARFTGAFGGPAPVKSWTSTLTR